MRSSRPSSVRGISTTRLGIANAIRLGRERRRLGSGGELPCPLTESGIPARGAVAGTLRKGLLEQVLRLEVDDHERRIGRLAHQGRLVWIGYEVHEVEAQDQEVLLAHRRQREIDGEVGGGERR
jgi:hypothetical protein